MEADVRRNALQESIDMPQNKSIGKIVIAIDPGPVQSAFVAWDGREIIDKGIYDNWLLLRYLDDNNIDKNFNFYPNYWVIEKITSCGMPVGEDVFETVFWIGVFCKTIGSLEIDNKRFWYCKRIPRIDVKMNLCHNSRAKDTNIVTALTDRFDPLREYGKYGKGTKKNPGPLFGLHDDEWQALALAITYYDTYCINGGG